MTKMYSKAYDLEINRFANDYVSGDSIIFHNLPDPGILISSGNLNYLNDFANMNPKIISDNY